MKQNRVKIQLWIPGLFDFKGGIQVFSGFFLNALSEVLSNSEISTFILHDQKSAKNNRESENINFYFFGRWPVSIRNFIYSISLFISSILSRPSLIITTHLNFTPVAWLINKLIGIPYWTIAHGVEAWNIEKPALRRSLNSAELILAVSEYTRQRLIKEQNIPPEKITLFPNTVDIKKFTPGEKSEALCGQYGIGSKKTILLSVCRLCASETYKSYDVVLKALPKIRHAIPDIHYLIVGKGDDTNRIKQLIKDYELEDCVTLTGFVPDEELCEHYRLCDLFVLPSKLEGFGIVYLEAMACGKPVVGGNQDGAVDALDHGNLGILVDPDDVAILSQTLIEMFEEKELDTSISESKEIREKMINLFGPANFQLRLAENLKNVGISP